MKQYRDMRFMAFALQLVGWALGVSGVYITAVVLARGPVLSEPYPGASVYSLNWGLRYLLVGICIVVAGQLLRAIADMATNSWHLRQIAESKAQTGGSYNAPTTV